MCTFEVECKEDLYGWAVRGLLLFQNILINKMSFPDTEYKTLLL